MSISFPSSPVDGQTYLFNGVLYTYFSSKTYWKSSKILWTGNQSTITFTTGSLAKDASYTESSAFSSSYLITSVSTSQAAWVRVYSKNSAIAADASRYITQDPDINAGVVLEIISDGNKTYTLDRSIYGNNTDSPISNLVYVKITNLTTTASIVVNLSLVKMGV